MWQVAKTAKTVDSARHSNFENGTPYNDCFAGKFGFSAMILFSRHRANYPAPPKWTPCGVQSPHSSSGDGFGSICQNTGPETTPPYSSGSGPQGVALWTRQAVREDSKIIPTKIDCLAGPQSHPLGTRSAVIRGSGFWSSVLHPSDGSVTAIPAGGAPGIDPTGQIYLL